LSRQVAQAMNGRAERAGKSEHFRRALEVEVLSDRSRNLRSGILAGCLQDHDLLAELTKSRRTGKAAGLSGCCPDQAADSDPSRLRLNLRYQKAASPVKILQRKRSPVGGLRNCCAAVIFDEGARHGRRPLQLLAHLVGVAGLTPSLGRRRQ
jgi:hypothetical protein